MRDRTHTDTPPLRRGPRVLVVTTVHTPLDARIHHRQIRSLAAAGASVTYAAPWAATGTDPGAVVAGVATVDVPRAEGRDRVSALRAVRRLLRAVGPHMDVIILHDPELVTATAGMLASLPPVILDVHEDLVASLSDRRWVPTLLRPTVSAAAVRLERRAERDLAGLLLAETAYQQRFRRPHPVVPNLPWLPPDPPPAGSVNQVAYLGRLSVGRGALDLLRLAQTLHPVPGAPRVRLIGPADASVAPALRRAAARGVLTWDGFVPNDQALELVAGSVAGLSPLHNLANYRSSMPTKVVEYLALGVPVVTTPLPQAARLVGGCGGGAIVPFGDVDVMAATVLSWARDAEQARRMGALGRAHVRTHHSWDVAAPRFVAEVFGTAGYAVPDGPVPSAAAGRRPLGAALPAGPRAARSLATDVGTS